MATTPLSPVQAPAFLFPPLCAGEPSRFLQCLLNHIKTLLNTDSSKTHFDSLTHLPIMIRFFLPLQPHPLVHLPLPTSSLLSPLLDPLPS